MQQQVCNESNGRLMCQELYMNPHTHNFFILIISSLNFHTNPLCVAVLIENYRTKK